MKGHLEQKISGLGQFFSRLTEKRSVPRLLFALSGSAFIIGWLAGMVTGSGVFSQVMRDKLALLSQVEHLKKELQDNKLAITRLETHHQIDKQTLAEVANSMTALEGDLATKKAQLKYYRTLVGDIQVSEKPFVSNIELFDVGQGEVGYRIIVQQGAVDKGKSSEISMQVAIEGSGEEGVISFPLTDIDPAFPSDADAFKIKYFKRFEGRILLPEAFEPEEIITRTWVKGHEKESMEKRFNWDIQNP